MWTKIYLALFAVAFLVMCVLIYLSYAQMQSIGFAPKSIAESYLSYRGWFWQSFWVSSLALLVLANVVLWLTRRAWALWLTFLFFVGFVLIQSWWLDQHYLDYVRQNNLAAEGAIGFGRIITALLCITIGVGIFFNQFLVLRMRDRIHGNRDAEIIQPEEAISVTDENTDTETASSEK